MTTKKKSIKKSAPTEKKCEGKLVRFKLEDVPGKKVFIAGTFNNWQPDTPMNDRKKVGVYTCQMRLMPGEYQYKFVVDGEWKLDSANPDSVPNGLGETNSVCKVTDK